MKCVLRMVMLIVDLIVVMIQIPYLFISGAILAYDCYRNKYNKKICAWIPAVGIIQYQCAEDGVLHKKEIRYKELFR